MLAAYRVFRPPVAFALCFFLYFLEPNSQKMNQ
jgi:hypothetical protein